LQIKIALAALTGDQPVSILFSKASFLKNHHSNIEISVL